ncbi:COG1470 family protein [Petrotoga sp. DB-2]
MKKFYILSFVFLLFTTFSFAQITVSPLSVEKDVRAGEEFIATINVIGGNTTQNVNIELYQIIQNIDGNFDYVEATPDNFLYSNWIEFPNSITVSPRSTTPVDAVVSIPSNAPFGTYNFILMITPEVETSGTIGIIIRYAIRITAHVQGTIITKVEVEDVKVVPDEEGKPVIESTIANGSSYDLVISTEAILRDKSGRMIERLPLKSPYMENNNITAQRIIKGNKVVFSGKPKYLLAPGEYKVNLFVNYSNRQRVFTYDINVPEEGFNFTPPTELALILDNTEFSYELYPGAVKTFVINLQNMFNQNVTVQVGGEEFASLPKDRSLLSWITLRSPSSFTVNAQGTSRVILSINVPKEVENGAYYGKIVLNAYEESGEFLSQKKVNVETVIGEVNYNFELTSSNYEKIEGRGIFSAMIKNTGERYIIPKGSLSILDNDGVSIGVYDFLPSSQEWLVPNQETMLIGEIPILEEEGYRYILTIYNNEQRLKVFEGELM